MGSMAEFFARGQQIAGQRQAQDMQQKVQQSQLDKIMEDRAIEKRRTSPGYTDALVKYMDPNTPTDSLAGFLARLEPSDWADAQTGRMNGLKIKAQADAAQISAADQIRTAQIEGVPFDAGQEPTTPMRKDAFIPAVGQRATTARSTMVQGNINSRAQSREEIAKDRLDIAKTNSDIAGRMASLREKLGEAQFAGIEARTKYTLGNLNREANMGTLDMGRVKMLLYDIMAGSGQQPDEKQSAVGAYAAAEIIDDVRTGTSFAEAVREAITKYDIKPGEGKDATKAADLFGTAPTAKKQGVAPPAAAAAPSSTAAPQAADPVAAVLKKLGLADTPANRARAEALRPKGK